MHETINNTVIRTAKKHGLNPDAFIHRFRYASNEAFTEKEINCIKEISTKSVLTNPDMLEIYMGFSSNVIRGAMFRYKTIKK